MGKKTRKKRGHVSAGHGRVGKHRFHPGYFGKVGMRWFHKKPNTTYRKSINVEMLWSTVGENVYDKAKASTGGDVPVINLVQKGIFKVLGKGKLPPVPVIVKAKYFSKMAEAKIVAAGGICVLTA